MSKPSMFSKDYRRVIRRRKILFRTFILLAAFMIIFVTYNKSAVPNLKKIVENMTISIKNNINKAELNNPVANEESAENNDKSVKQPVDEPKKMEVVTGQYKFTFPNNETMDIAYEKTQEDIKLIGIKPLDKGISFDISSDGKSIVFDNPRISDIWIYNSDGSNKKLNPDNYTSTGEGKYIFSKNEIMGKYENQYAWASKPKFLKDGRIIYQSNLPWFKEVNTYHLWIVNRDGGDNFRCLSTDETEPIKYGGYMDDGRLIIEYGGARYGLNPDTKGRDRID